MSTKTSRKKNKPLATTFSGHIKELRTRLMLVALVFFVLSAVAYSFRDPLIALVRQPLGDQQLIYLTPAGGFSFIFSVTMYAAMVVTAPFLMYHIYQFVKPSLPASVRRYSWQVFVASNLLMIAGVLFGYFFAVPAALKFLTTFAGDAVAPNLTAESYLNFFMAYVAGLGILFQLPLLLMFWNWMKPLQPGQLLQSQRYVIAGAFIAAALITPTPDAVNQAMVALPIVVIYQFGAIGVYVANRKKRRATRSAVKAKGRVTTQQPARVSTHKPTVAAKQKPPTSTASPSVQAVQASTSRRSLDGFSAAGRSMPHRSHRGSVPSVTRKLTPSARTASGPRRSLDGFSVVR